MKKIKHIIYLHGLNSNSQAYKGQLLRQYCQQYFPEIQVHCPDLNHTPEKVMILLDKFIDNLKHNDINNKALKNENIAVIGSSLGGFFATLLFTKYHFKTVLLNPSLFPEQSLNRFVSGSLDDYDDNQTLYITKGGWQICKSDLLWFMHHRPEKIFNIKQLLILLKQGDDVLDYRQSLAYFHANGFENNIDKNGHIEQKPSFPHILLEPNGDHVMSDFQQKLAIILDFITQ